MINRQLLVLFLLLRLNNKMSPVHFAYKTGYREDSHQVTLMSRTNYNVTDK